MSTRIRAVFLDFQDTLARFREGPFGVKNSAYGLYVQAAREHGIDLDPEAVLLPTDEAWANFQTPDGPAHPEGSRDAEAFAQVRIAVHSRRLARAGISGALAESIARRVDELEGQSERYELFDDVLPALDRVADAGVKAIVVSNHMWRLEEMTRELGLGDHIAAVVNSARVGYRKPHPRIYQHALEVSDVPADATVMVGDSLSHDVSGAERHGIHGVLLDREGTTRPPEGTKTIRTLMEIPLAWP
ncbi:MAG: HAD family hydrolase [Chloroflexi bacterium]|nr:HAD family hydrolase [Chloroflexota bacterium]